MTDISTHLSSAEKHLKIASDAICNGTMSDADRRKLREALALARVELDAANDWITRSLNIGPIGRRWDVR